MKLLTGLFRAARKRLQTTDNDMGMFREKLDALVAGKDTLGDEEVAAKVQELVEITNDLPESEEKAKLLRFIEDFKSVKEQDAAVAQEAAKAVADLFEKLDTEAMKDSPDMVTEPAAKPAAEEGAEPGDPIGDPAAEETTAGEETDGACEEVIEGQNEENEVQDDDEKIAEYTLEDIYQYCKKRQKEDAEAESDEEESGEEETESIAEETAEEELDEVTQDHAPWAGISLPGKEKANGGISAMFAELKNGGR